jgi:hypothetical protein
MSMDSTPPIKRHHLANWIKKEDLSTKVEVRAK